MAIELAVEDDELLARVAMDADWLSPSMPGLGSPPFTTGTFAQVTMRSDDGVQYFVQLELDRGGQLSRRTSEFESDKVLEDLAIGHEGDVVEGHFPLAAIEDLGSEFAWWSFSSGVTDLEPDAQQGRTQQDECGSESAPIRFPGKSADTAVPGATTTDSPLPERPNGGGSCPDPDDAFPAECELTASLSSSLVQAVAAEVFQRFGFSFEPAADRDRILNCEFDDPPVPDTDFTCAIRLPDGRTATARSLISDDLFYQLIDVSISDEPELELAPDGLGAASFGDDVTTVRQVLGTTFGQPDTTSDAPTYSSGACPGDVVLVVGYENGLVVSFDSSDRFVGYRYRYAGEVDGLEIHTTSESIGVGSHVNDLRAAYRERLRATQIGSLWEFRVDTDEATALTFVTTGGEDDNVVEEVRAGLDCTYR